MYDYLIVGMGLFGCTFARIMAEAGKKILMIDKRSHIGGNCYSEQTVGIHVHKYGPHIFHTNNAKVWDFLNRFTKFNNYLHCPKVSYRGKMLSFPINLMTMHQLWGVTTPAEAEAALKQKRVLIHNPSNLEDWIVSQVGYELYEVLIEGYTTKQWGRSPRELPASIIKRLPIRMTFDDRYFSDTYQGVPVNGYTAMFEEMLDSPNIRTVLGVDFFQERRPLAKLAERIVYTGKLDELYAYQFGELEYRSLSWETHTMNQLDFQGNSSIHHSEASIPYTRSIEHKHFDPACKSTQTIVTYEYPKSSSQDSVPCYPVRDNKNLYLLSQYMELNRRDKVILGGRLATYQYFDMHQIVAQAMTVAQSQLEG